MRLSKVIHALHQQAQHSATHGTINASEIAHFSRLSSQWWNEQGEFSFLHKMNPVRVQFIREKLLEAARERDGEQASTSKTLHGLDVLDVGCGGGLLSEVSTARLYQHHVPILCAEPCTSRSQHIRNRRLGS